MILERLQKWYASQCDGDWEHGNGIEIGTLDNRGWSVKIDLVDTTLEKMTYAELQEPTKEGAFEESDRWMLCRVRDRVWEGVGDETKLERILQEFVSWAESAGS